MKQCPLADEKKFWQLDMTKTVRSGKTIESKSNYAMLCKKNYLLDLALLEMQKVLTMTTPADHIRNVS